MLGGEKPHYWVWLRQSDRELGAGFFITRRNVVTAAHCLKNMDDENQNVDIVLSNEQVINAKVVEKNLDIDLALIDVSWQDCKKHPIEIPVASTPFFNARWWGPSRPPGDTDPHLVGRVSDPHVSWCCEGGSSIEVSQLESFVEIGDFSGYSGGAVQYQDQDNDIPQVFGLLVEQYMDQAAEARASNVLLATTMGMILRAFDALSIGELRRRLPGQAMPTPRSDDTVDRAPNGVVDLPTQRFGIALKYLKSWHALGMIEPDEVAILRLRVAASILMQTTGDPM